MPFLIHPTHRKFIKLLRSYADSGVEICITKDDICRYKQIFERTTIAMEKHRAIYRLVLEILNRKTILGERHPFDHAIVDQIEKILAKSERKSPCNTFKGTFLKPLVLLLLRKLQK